MRTHGTLVKWNEDRGFGFIAPAQGSDEIFVHISAFPRDGSRPRVGELISFEIADGNNGKTRAIRVLRPGSRVAPNRTYRRESSEPKRGALPVVLGLLTIGAIGAYGYTALMSSHSVARSEYSTPIAPIAPSQDFQCDGRTHCSQMTSCAEATYFLKHCPNVKMDGNNDGEPCEQQWCN
jgi:cold shock CspA family protein